jgi:hypothetical protein
MPSNIPVTSTTTEPSTLVKSTLVSSKPKTDSENSTVVNTDMPIVVVHSSQMNVKVPLTVLISSPELKKSSINMIPTETKTSISEMMLWVLIL